jgi:hypothetical protein
MRRMIAHPVRRKGRPRSDSPQDPDKIHEIVHLKDAANMGWRKIGHLLELSHQAPYLLYKRWRDWSYDSRRKGT